MRDLTGPTQSRAIRDLLQSLFVTEALEPSESLWLLSAWITDAPIIDNSARQFSGVDPEWNAGEVVLSAALKTILERGGSVNIVTRNDEINAPFLSAVRRFRTIFGRRLRLVLEPDFHDKGLVGDRFELAGSMNFTRKGIATNDEHVMYRTDVRQIAERRLVLNNVWQARLNDPY